MAGNKFWKIKRKVIHHYDRLAKIYDALYGYEQSLKIKEALDALKINSSDVVLDVGCGTGLLFKHIDNSVNMVVGIDFSKEALKVAKDLIKRFGLNTVSLIRADADFLPFRNSVFDKVFAITLLQNMPNPALTLREIMRVTKDCSKIVITGLKKAFSIDYFSWILKKSGFSFLLLDVSEDIKCYIAVCGKSNLTKNINTCGVKIIS
jgi:demethylmenaquinone methyltransferase/2-methoxy-6-polyprenyl-1,4-benzoquinol methylase